MQKNQKNKKQHKADGEGTGSCLLEVRQSRKTKLEIQNFVKIERRLAKN